VYRSPYIQSRWVAVDGLRIYCRYSEGDGLPVILLQGGMLDSSTLTWRRTLESLPPRYRVFAPDLPGYGKSEKPSDAPYTTAYFIDFIARFMDAMDLPRAVLFGSSMSGAAAIGLALQHPERIIGLGLAGVYGWQPRVPLHPLAYAAAHLPGLPTLVQTVLRKGPGVMRLALHVAIAHPDAITEDLVEDAQTGIMADGQIRTFVTWLRSELGPKTVHTNYADRLHEITAPVLILHGAHDWLMPLAYAYRAHERFPHAVLHVFEQGGHMVPREYPRRANRLITDFLERLAP